MCILVYTSYYYSGAGRVYNLAIEFSFIAISAILSVYHIKNLIKVPSLLNTFSIISSERRFNILLESVLNKFILLINNSVLLNTSTTIFSNFKSASNSNKSKRKFS